MPFKNRKIGLFKTKVTLTTVILMKTLRKAVFINQTSDID